MFQTKSFCKGRPWLWPPCRHEAMACPGLEDLPPELLHRILLLCAIPDVLTTAEALGREDLLEVLGRTHLWTRCSIPGPWPLLDALLTPRSGPLTP